MTENKRFTVDYDITVGNYSLHDECKAKGVDGYIAYLSDEERANNLCDLLNEQEEQIQELKYEKEKVVKTLKQYFDRYTQMAIELRYDKYGNGVCHNVTEVIMEIADKLDINIIDDGDVDD